MWDTGFHPNPLRALYLIIKEQDATATTYLLACPSFDDNPRQHCGLGRARNMTYIADQDEITLVQGHNLWDFVETTECTLRSTATAACTTTVRGAVKPWYESETFSDLPLSPVTIAGPATPTTAPPTTGAGPDAEATASDATGDVFRAVGRGVGGVFLGGVNVIAVGAFL
ncbi:hypothetical protein BDW74DRAFT_160691 [Aspergillus multicolor]|uniref:uncharacterized protein n=1 Tax=Aspergillus multicolor TaxID=41759 RepID=UPI003CCD7681